LYNEISVPIHVCVCVCVRALHILHLISLVCTGREILTPWGLLTLDSGKYVEISTKHKEYFKEPAGAQ